MSEERAADSFSGNGRNREWERRQREAATTTTVTYRGIPRELKGRILEIAQAEGVTVGEIARLFLEHALARYEDGSLEIPTCEIQVARRVVDFS